jgi:hypothetical protein
LPQADLHRELLEQKDRQLICARYTFHKVIWSRYKEMVGRGQMTEGQAKSAYQKAMLNYDGIVNGAIDGASVEANVKDMERGFV